MNSNAQPKPYIVAERVCKSFGTHQVLKDVSTVFHTGEVTVIIGASGSGKSTLLRLLAGLLVPDFIYNIGTTVLNGGISMVIFFFVNKIIFPEGEKAAK